MNPNQLKAPDTQSVEARAKRVPSPDTVREVGSWVVHALHLDRAGRHLTTRRDPESGVLSVQEQQTNGSPAGASAPDKAPLVATKELR
jgi:hypothetical protein